MCLHLLLPTLSAAAAAGPSLLATAGAVAVGFLAGSLPTALLVVAWLKGVDVRTVGSGNVGATNASRAFATRRAQLMAFLGIYLVDFAKGFVPVLLLPGLASSAAGGDASGSGLPLAVGVAAILGHCFSPWLGGRGGKGVATTTGVFAAVEPVAVLVALVVFFVVRQVSGQVFWGSIGLGIALAAAVIARDPATAFSARLGVSLAALAVAAFLVWTHRSNLRKALGRRAEATP